MEPRTSTIKFYFPGNPPPVPPGITQQQCQIGLTPRMSASPPSAVSTISGTAVLGKTMARVQSNPPGSSEFFLIFRTVTLKCKIFQYRTTQRRPRKESKASHHIFQSAAVEPPTTAVQRSCRCLSARYAWSTCCHHTCSAHPDILSARTADQSFSAARLVGVQLVSFEVEI